MPEYTRGGTYRPLSPSPGSRAQPENPDDQVLAAVLIRMWALASGRTLPSDVPPSRLSEEELIAFWADDMTEAAGRHARPKQTVSSAGPGDWGEASRPAAKRRRRKRRSGGRAAATRRALRAGTRPA
jgi:hypothetical protein